MNPREGQHGCDAELEAAPVPQPIFNKQSSYISVDMLPARGPFTSNEANLNAHASSQNVEQPEQKQKRGVGRPRKTPKQQ